jgi:hypothetical protein
MVVGSPPQETDVGHIIEVPLRCQVKRQTNVITLVRDKTHSGNSPPLGDICRVRLGMRMYDAHKLRQPVPGMRAVSLPDPACIPAGNANP